MRPLSLSLAAFAISAGACTAQVVGNGHPTQETRTLTGFSQVANHGSLEVRVTQGSTFTVVVNADSNIVPIVTTTVSGGVLTIGTSKSFTSSDPARVDVTLPSFAGADNEGSGTLTVAGGQTQGISLKNGGSGSLTFAGQAGAVGIDLEGSGMITLSGSGARLDGLLDGSGSIAASQFPVGEATLTCNGSGNANLTINGNATLTINGSGSIQAAINGGTANFSINGSGSISWTGNATVGTSSVQGSGTLTHH